jgi:UDP-glucose 4-epimerase
MSSSSSTRDAVLVTGGAGYIGSHVVRQLCESGEQVVVLDRDLVTRLLAEHRISTILHFAAHTIVPESVSDPLKYYGNNTCATRSLLECAVRAGVKHFIFSSTAAVYGMPENGIASEDTPTAPINPYGSSKLMSEWMLRDADLAHALSYVALRYFNVAGADPGGRIGQSTRLATLLTKVACEAAVGKRPHVSIYGTDYPTPDGTGIRDYIHVEDLATAHIDALRYLRDGGKSAVLNCGYGHGYSVREVLAAVERCSGITLVKKEELRRAGDPPTLVAAADRIRTVLGWAPRFDDLDLIVSTALRWEQRLLKQPAE